jgi:hypothetical protein
MVCHLAGPSSSRRDHWLNYISIYYLLILSVEHLYQVQLLKTLQQNKNYCLHLSQMESEKRFFLHENLYTILNHGSFK